MISVKYPRRLLGGFVDFFSVYVVYLIMFVLLVTPFINKHFDYDYKQQQITEIGRNTAVDLGLAEKETDADGNERIVIYSTVDSYIESKSKDKTLSDEEIEELRKEYKEKIDTFNSTLNSNDEYNSLSKSIKYLDFGGTAVSLLIGELIFLIVIPLVNKRRRTLGNIVASTYTVNADGMALSTSNFVIRTLFMILIETMFFVYVFKNSALYVSLIILAISLCLTKGKFTLHDLVSKTAVVQNANNKVSDNYIRDCAENGEKTENFSDVDNSEVNNSIVNETGQNISSGSNDSENDFSVLNDESDETDSKG